MSDNADLIELRRILEDHIKSDNIRYKHYDDMHEKNTNDIATLTTAVSALTLSTQGLVDGWKAARTLQRFIKWLSGFSVLGVAAAWLAGKIHF